MTGIAIFAFLIICVIIWIVLNLFGEEPKEDKLHIPSVGQFKKVNKSQFQIDYSQFMEGLYGLGIKDIKPKTKWDKVYESIKLPERATTGSAGYDFFSPVSFILQPGETIKFPTGIKVDIDAGWVLKLYPRSSVGFKYDTMLSNTVGIVDSDYYYSNNDGHMWVKLKNNGTKPLVVVAGDRVVQGIFVPFGITYDDCTVEKRIGGIGSSGK